MKIAVLSDIHGNMDALISVLEDAKKEDVQKFFICGDLALAGAEPAQVIEFMKELSAKEDVTIIQGNTDEMIANATPESIKKLTSVNKIMGNALKYADEILSPEHKNYLANLPAQKHIEIDEISILLVHGSPRRNNEDIFPEQNIEKIEEMVENTTENLIFCGHTHLPAGYQTKKQTVVNVGSVGRPFTQEPHACYVILEIKGKEFEIIHKFIEYDIQKAASKLEKVPFEGSDKLAQMLIKPTTRYPQ